MNEHSLNESYIESNKSVELSLIRDRMSRLQPIVEMPGVVRLDGSLTADQWTKRKPTENRRKYNRNETVNCFIALIKGFAIRGSDRPEDNRRD